MSSSHLLFSLVTLTATVTLATGAMLNASPADAGAIPLDPGVVEGPALVEVSADQLTLIHAPSGGGFRVLLSFPGLADLAHMTVHSARLEIPGLRLAESAAWKLYPATTPWSAADVGWQTPWREAGGDYDAVRALRTNVTAGEARETTRFNVSSVIRSIVNDGAANLGFLLMPSQHVADRDRPVGFPEALATDVGALTGIKLVVFGTLSEPSQ